MDRQVILAKVPGPKNRLGSPKLTGDFMMEHDVLNIFKPICHNIFTKPMFLTGQLMDPQFVLRPIHWFGSHDHETVVIFRT